MKVFNIILMFCVVCFLAACGSAKDKKQDGDTKAGAEAKSGDAAEFKSVADDSEEDLLRKNIDRSKLKPIDPAVYKSKGFTVRYGQKIDPPAFDFNVDLSKLSLNDIRYKKYELYARKGYLFHDASIRAYFNRMKWYQPVYWLEDIDFTLNEEEEAFFQKVKQREQELLSSNYIASGKNTGPNMKNIINMAQFKKIDPKLSAMIEKTGFALAEANHIELYHLYEQNDYYAIPSFITTDIYLQLFHVYFTYLLTSLEKEKFIPIITKLSEEMYLENQKVYQSSGANLMLKDAAEYNMMYYAVPYYLLSGDKLELSAKYAKIFDEHINKINASKDIDWQSKLFDQLRFDYSMFKPRGNYAKSERMQNYFKAMMWLQTAPFSLKYDHHIARLMLSATIMKKNGKLLKEYLSIYEPTSFIMGKADNLSLLQAIQAVEDMKLGFEPAKLISKENIAKLIPALRNLNPEKIKPVVRLDNEFGFTVDTSTIMQFMPQRYNPDSEIMSNLVNLAPMGDKSRRAFPKGLDVFAAMSNEVAEDILINYFKEAEFWPGYAKKLEKLKKDFKQYDFSNTLYDSWIDALNSLFTVLPEYPYYMHNYAWQKKNLNTSMASWAELKHDAILYAKQNWVAECGGGDEENFVPPPPPRVVGYVEPNTAFWKKCVNILDKTTNGLKKYGLLTDVMQSSGDRMKENAEFLLNVSEKELKHERLSDQEYETIKVFGSTIEYFTQELYYQNLEDSGDEPDEELPIIADVITSNNECLEEAVGYGNDIFVVVEIEGYLYLTRGAVFSYYEFKQPVSNRLTDKEWRKMLNDNKEPAMPSWIFDIFLKIKTPDAEKQSAMPAEVEARYTYSSGC